MAHCKPTCTESGYGNLGGGGGSSGTGTVDWKNVTLSVSSLLQDPGSAINSASYGTSSSIVLKATDESSSPVLGRMNPGNGNAPTCPVWTWTIDDSFSYTSNSQILVQVKFTGTPNDTYFFYGGIYNGSDPLSGDDQGLFGSVRVDTGATGVGLMGKAAQSGTQAASFAANGGMFSTVFNIKASVARPQNAMTQSKTNTGPAYGESARSNIDPVDFSGSKVHGFIAIGATSGSGARSGGTFAGIEIRYAVVPMFT